MGVVSAPAVRRMPFGESGLDPGSAGRVGAGWWRKEVTPRQAHLSKLKRVRTRLQFRLERTRNQLEWERDELVKDGLARQCRDLTWLLFELDDQVRAAEYGVDLPP